MRVHEGLAYGLGGDFAAAEGFFDDGVEVGYVGFENLRESREAVFGCSGRVGCFEGLLKGGLYSLIAVDVFDAPADGGGCCFVPGEEIT